ncbi:MAG: HipA domain-containing protein [Lachnospiraceae bacterium]|nr:HipA domain-containing protein [Lachnospiraceae bacterium]
MAREVTISIEIRGKQQPVGVIRGDSYQDARFKYFRDYLDIDGIKPISISLPLQEEEFDVGRTKNFFEGLLPEGFSRRAVADWVKADENDYLTILEKLGQEVLGAIQVMDDGTSFRERAYEPLSEEQVKKLAAEGATRSTELLMQTHLSLTGASGKAGLYYEPEENRWYLPKGDAASTHIVKQSHIRLNHIVLNEQLCMQTAKKLGIDVPESFVINLGSGADSDVLFATKRYDRSMNSDVKVDGLICPYRLHQEDFSQALSISPASKYEHEDSGYLRRMFKLVNEYSAKPIEDQLKLWDMIVYSYLIGNTDCHVKNFSLTYGEDFKSIRLSPAYDIVCTQAYGSTSEMSFFIGGELDINAMNRDTFKVAARDAGLGEKLAMKRFDYLADNIEAKLDEAAQEMYEQGLTDVYLIADRMREVVKR